MIAKNTMTDLDGGFYIVDCNNELTVGQYFPEEEYWFIIGDERPWYFRDEEIIQKIDTRLSADSVTKFYNSLPSIGPFKKGGMTARETRQITEKQKDPQIGWIMECIKNAAECGCYSHIVSTMNKEQYAALKARGYQLEHGNFSDIKGVKISW